MPKMKSHRASRKRFGVTATGKLKRRQAGKKHLNGPKTTKRKRHLRPQIVKETTIAATYVGLMGKT
jgi:large subunit ribosomal protein L35